MFKTRNLLNISLCAFFGLTTMAAFAERPNCEDIHSRMSFSGGGLDGASMESTTLRSNSAQIRVGSHSFPLVGRTWAYCLKDGSPVFKVIEESGVISGDIEFGQFTKLAKERSFLNVYKALSAKNTKVYLVHNVPLALCAYYIDIDSKGHHQICDYFPDEEFSESKIIEYMKQETRTTISNLWW